MDCGVHQFQALGRGADGDALAFGEREDPAVVVGVDDPRAAVAHLPALAQRLGEHLDALDAMPGVEDLRRVDDRVGNGRQVGHAAALGRGDAEHGEQQAAGRVAHVVAQSHGVVGVVVHRREHAADVAIAQQAAPPASQLFRVRRLVGGELPDVRSTAPPPRFYVCLHPPLTWSAVADAEDVRRLALSLADVVENPSDGFDFRVGGRGFVWSYPERVPGRGRTIRTDIAVLYVGDEAEKQALLFGEPDLFFTAPGYGGFPLVMLRLERVGKRRLRELITDAWRLRAGETR